MWVAVQPNVQLFLTHPMNERIENLSLALQHKITQEIKQKGLISFARFMEMALYEPGLGYYSAGLKKFGREGDFVTSPELGSQFARCLARSFAPVLSAYDAPVLLELGAGQGSFCCDVLRALDGMDALPESYWILEVSADLKHVQQQQVEALPPHLSQRVHWLASVPDQSFDGIVFGNEVVDALPVEVFQTTAVGYQRLMLANQAGQLQEQWHDFPDHLAQQLAQKQLELPEGYRSEFVPNLGLWLKGITQHLRAGVVMWVDYGYGAPQFHHPQRNQGTLVCHQRHEANFNPYQSIGLQDITAFVDFTHLAHEMDQLGLDVCGFTTQADFLMSLGLPDLIDEAAPYDVYFHQVSEMKRLVLPTEMGEKFKVLAATRNHKATIPGFDSNRLFDL